MQVLQLTPEQIAALPPDQQQQVMELVCFFQKKRIDTQRAQIMGQ